MTAAAEDGVNRLGQGETMRAEKDPKKINEAALHEQLASECPGAILEISVFSLGFAFSEAQGHYVRNVSRPLRTNDLFRSASVTKSVTATLAVYLAANRYWNLDDPITNFLIY